MSYVGNTPTTQNFISGTDQFTGNGSSTNWTLSRFVNSVNDIEVVIANVVQNPTSYSISGNTLTISPAVSNGVAFYARYLSTTTQSIAPSQNSVGTLQLADAAVTTTKLADSSVTTAKIAAGAVITDDLADSAVTAVKLAASSVSTAKMAAEGISGQVLTSNGGSVAPSYQTLSGVPSGSVTWFAASSAPTGYLKANGAAISRSTYSALFAAIGTTFGAGDGSTTFNVPDLRGQFLRGWDDGRGVDTGRVFGSAQSDAIRNITGIVGGRWAAFQSASGAFANTGSGNAYVNGGSYGTFGADFDASRQVPTAAENRPRNTALLACIKF